MGVYAVAGLGRRFPQHLTLNRLAGPPPTPEEVKALCDLDAPYLSPGLDSQSVHFVTEIFFITQQLFTAGLTPTGATVPLPVLAIESICRNQRCRICIAPTLML
jgi:hypothetical protein